MSTIFVLPRLLAVISLGLRLDVRAELDGVVGALALACGEGLGAGRAEELGDAEGARGGPDADRAAGRRRGGGRVGAAEHAAVRARRVGVRVAAERGQDRGD